MNKYKRASLSLSINAIVVLVLAITMLGLGLAFTKGMFSKFSSKLTVPEPDIPATADDRIVLPADTIQLRKNKEATFSVNVYNDNWQTDVSGSLTCFKDGAQNGPSYNTIPQAIEAGEDAGFKFVISKLDTPIAGTWVCNLVFADTLGDPVSKQIVISIK